MTTKRFTYADLTPEQFKAGLVECGLVDESGRADIIAFATLFGLNPATVERWIKIETGRPRQITKANGDKAVHVDRLPPWVTVALSYLVEHGCELAYQVATETIEHDALHPDLGRYPYARKRRLPPDFAAGVHNIVEKRRELAEKRAERMAERMADEIEDQVALEMKRDRRAITYNV